jgi:hypothetical protein
MWLVDWNQKIDTLFEERGKEAVQVETRRW